VLDCLASLLDHPRIAVFGFDRSRSLGEGDELDLLVAAVSAPLIGTEDGGDVISVLDRDVEEASPVVSKSDAGFDGCPAQYIVHGQEVCATSIYPDGGFGRTCREIAVRLLGGSDDLDHVSSHFWILRRSGPLARRRDSRLAFL